MGGHGGVEMVSGGKPGEERRIVGGAVVCSVS